MAPTHARLGRHRDLFERADPALTYFLRARSLLPTDPEIIYYCGQARWEAGDTAGACADWRDSLNRLDRLPKDTSDRLLKDVLERGGQRLRPVEILADALPDKPEVIERATGILVEEGRIGPEDRHQYRTKARDLLAYKTDGKTAADWELEARLEDQLERPDQALEAYRRAVGLAPRETQWRIAYAQLLVREGMQSSSRSKDERLELLKEAEHELWVLVSRQGARGEAARQRQLVLGEIQRLNPAETRTRPDKAGNGDRPPDVSPKPKRRAGRNPG
jgi:tetratricopeptide (TPR) repeat protein